jgi:8-amino-7-oxononanoate synthase
MGMERIHKFIDQKLRDREEGQILRILKQMAPDSKDFLSNDFFSFSKEGLVRRKMQEYAEDLPQWVGSTGSRLLSGNTALHQKVEGVLSKYLQAEDGLFFTNGYLANLSLLSVLGDKKTIFFADGQIHASMKEGCQAGFGKKISFRHNDLSHLERLLSSHGDGHSLKIVLTEGLFSMQGDQPPLEEMLDLCKHYQAALIIDEAHSLGVIGPNGLGLSESVRGHSNLLARVFPMGKGPGIMGAFVACRSNLKNFMLNFARPFVYSTAPSSDQLVAVLASVDLLKSRAHFSVLQDRIRYFTERVAELGRDNISRNQGPIQVYHHQDGKGGIAGLKAKSLLLKEHKIACLPIFAPTVPPGQERMRIVLHAHNTEQEIDALLSLLLDDSNKLNDDYHGK